MSRLHGFSLEDGSLLSGAGRCKASFYSAILRSCKECPAHQNIEEKCYQKREIKTIPVPQQRRQKFDRGGTSTQKRVLCEINIKARMC